MDHFFKEDKQKGEGEQCHEPRVSIIYLLDYFDIILFIGVTVIIDNHLFFPSLEEWSSVMFIWVLLVDLPTPMRKRSIESQSMGPGAKAPELGSGSGSYKLFDPGQVGKPLWASCL